MPWSKKLSDAIKSNDKQFASYLKKKGIKPNSIQASRAWSSSGFQAKQTKIFARFKKY